MVDALPYYVAEQEQEMQVMPAFGGDRGKYEVGVRVDDTYETTTVDTKQAALEALNGLVAAHDLDYDVPADTGALFEEYAVDRRPSL